MRELTGIVQLEDESPSSREEAGYFCMTASSFDTSINQTKTALATYETNVRG